jgi:hypothetical protein
MRRIRTNIFKLNLLCIVCSTIIFNLLNIFISRLVNATILLLAYCMFVCLLVLVLHKHVYNEIRFVKAIFSVILATVCPLFILMLSSLGQYFSETVVFFQAYLLSTSLFSTLIFLVSFSVILLIGFIKSRGLIKKS